MAKKHLIKKEAWVEMLNKWPSFAPPARPSKFDLKIWEQKIKEKIGHGKVVRALVLGATPEIRDLLAKYHMKTTLMDVNSGMVRGLAKLMKYKRQRKETTVINNWLNIKNIFSVNYFDFVIGHSFLNNIPWKFYSKLLFGIKSVLKKDGYLLTVFPVLEPLKRLSADQVVSLYLKQPKFFNNFSNRWYILDVLKQLDYNPKTRQVFFGKAKNRLIKAIAQKNLPSSTIDLIWTFGRASVVDGYVGTHPPLKEIVPIIKKYFVIEKIGRGPHISYQAHPNLVLIPKK
jgi:hypothetical protein